MRLGNHSLFSGLNFVYIKSRDVSNIIINIPTYMALCDLILKGYQTNQQEYNI